MNLLTPQEHMLAFLDHTTPMDEPLELYVKITPDGQKKPIPARPKPDEKGEFKPEAAFCPVCGKPKTKPGNLLCPDCFVHVQRIQSKRLIGLHTKPTDKTCMICQQPAVQGATLQEIDAFKGTMFASGILKTSGVFRHPESNIVCAGCLSLFVTIISNPGRVQPFAFAPLDGIFITRTIPPWWRIPWRPALVYRIDGGGGDAHRAIFAEVSVDPATIVLNISRDRQSERPETYVLPMASDPALIEADLETLVTATRHEIEAKGVKKDSLDKEFHRALRGHLIDFARERFGIDWLAALAAASEMRRFALHEEETEDD